MCRTAVNTLNSSEVMYLRSVASSFMTRVDREGDSLLPSRVELEYQSKRCPVDRHHQTQCLQTLPPAKPTRFSVSCQPLLSSGLSHRLLQVISPSLSRQHASYVTRSKLSPSVCVAMRNVFSASHSLSRQRAIYATMNVTISGECSRRTCMNCGSCLRTLSFTVSRPSQIPFLFVWLETSAKEGRNV